jgi:8-oxo-dGTP pyrophosphatase MutT (NUDIX family)
MNTGTEEPARWVRGDATVLATTRVLELRSVSYRHPGRPSGRDFIVVAAPSWVNVVALTPSGRIVVVRQFRFGIDAISLEIPGGVVEPGEDPVAAGVRELREETGYVGTGARLIGSAQPNPAIQDNRCHFVLVEGAERRADTDWDPDEEIEVATAPVEEVLSWARGGRITHGLVQCALFHFEPLWRTREGAV